MDKKEVLKITKNLPQIIGIAPNAFSRVVFADYFPNFSIVCFKWRGETDYIARDIEVYCVEKEYPGTMLSKMNTGEILNLPGVINFIRSKVNPHLLIYKPTMKINTQAFRMGWKIVGNSPDVKHDIENKLAFRNLLGKCGITSVPGETVLLTDLDEELYKSLTDKWGPRIVFQVCEMTTGGGTGTAFINSINDFRGFISKFKAKKEILNFIKNVNVTSFIEGVPASIVACATKYGVITGSIQTQILDIPDVRDIKEGSGLFSGHDFSYAEFNNDLNSQAKLIAQKFGEYIYNNLGYRGIFGIDLIVNMKSAKVYPIECNPRYTDAFPLISQIYIRNGAIPMDVFHVFENMNIDYKIDVNEISDSYKTHTSASQIILETRSNDWTKVTGELKAGVYQINYPNSDNNGLALTINHQTLTISYLRPGYRFEDLKNSSEFLVTEGVPFKGQKYPGGSRILRLIFSESVLESPHVLTGKTKALVSEVYRNIALNKTDPQIMVNDFLGLKIAEISKVKDLEDAKKIAPDIINIKGINEHFGFIRPEKVGWGMNIEGGDTIKTIRSGRLQKHLKSWLLNMNKFGLTYEVIDSLSSKDYTLWFKKYYDLLSSKEKANIQINPGWLSYKKKMGKNIGGIFLFKDKKFIGGNIFISSDEKITVAYGVIDKLKNPNWSLGALVDYLSLKYASDHGFKRIGFGQDNNLYGHHLSSGLLQYKLNFGMLPGYKEKVEIFSTKFVKMEKFNDPVAFLGIKNNKKVFYILSRSKDTDYKLNTDLEVIRVYLPENNDPSERIVSTKTPR